MVISVETLQAPAWLGSGGLAQCRQALAGRQARETWKYSPLAKVTQALLETPQARCSPVAAPPAGVSVRRFSALGTTPSLHLDLERYPLAGIAAALAGDGWLVEVHDTPKRPLRINSPATGLAAPLLLRVAADCQVQIEETSPIGGTAASSIPAAAGHHVQVEETDLPAGTKRGGLKAQVLLLSLARGAQAHWARSQLMPEAEQWSLLAARLDDHAGLTLHQQTVAATLQRMDLHIGLHGQGARLTSIGAALANPGGRLDQQYVVEHIGKNTYSRIKQHNLAAGGARCTFNGRIHIHPGAAGADADLSNRNLALAANAEVNTKPELEIHNDDVRCAHGATVGQLDEAALFYLQSRGLGGAAAKRLLGIGFLREGLSGPFAGNGADAFMAQLSPAAWGG